jgi:hypothetical protein
MSKEILSSYRPDLWCEESIVCKYLVVLCGPVFHMI